MVPLQFYVTVTLFQVQLPIIHFLGMFFTDGCYLYYLGHQLRAFVENLNSRDGHPVLNPNSQGLNTSVTSQS